MKIKTEDLIQELAERTRKVINQAEGLKELDYETLNWRPEPERWSIFECLEHLNRYGRFYIPEIQNRIKASKHPAEEIFKSGPLGNYSALSMLPKERLNAMKTPKNMNPIGSSLDTSTLEEFLTQQKQFLKLLDESRSVSLNKTKTGLSITDLIKFRLGDTFRFVIYHHVRHMLQIHKNLEAKRVIQEGQLAEAMN